MVFALTWLPDVLLRAGLKVAEVDGWRERGRGEVGATFGIICHHTAGPKVGNMPSLHTLINGRPDLPGPLCQLGLGRDGAYYVVAAGRANHAGAGLWQGSSGGNMSFIGIEAENTGHGEDPWPDVQLDAYQRGVAAILSHTGLPAERCAGHKEYALPAGRKTDPTLDMNAFRAAVAAIMRGTAAPPVLIPSAEPARPNGAAGRPTLRRGANDPAVRLIQAALKLAQTGVFDAQLEARVRVLQREHGLVPDGIFGPKSWAALDTKARPA